MSNLKEVLEHAYTRVPLYMQILDKEKLNINELIEGKWEDVPVVNKEDFINKDCEDAISIENLSLFHNRKLTYSSTSGSTGTCLFSYWTEESYNDSLLELWILRKIRYGIKPHDRFCYFYATPNDTEIRKDDILIQQNAFSLGINRHSLDDDSISKIIDMIIEYDPVWMMLQPSVSALLADYIARNNTPSIKSLKYIELTGERLFEHTRDLIVQAFQCKIADQYGCYEVNSIAYECEKGRMHCMNSNVHVEILKDGVGVNDGEEGEIVVTSLKNPVMPFVRYKTGDYGRIYHNKQCDCGSRMPILELTSGRVIDWVIHEDGRKTSAYVFATAVDRTNRMLGRVIKQFQVEQVNEEEIIIRLVIDEDEDEDNICDTFEDNLCDEITDDFNIYYEIYNELLNNVKGNKLKYFINNVQER